MTPARRMEKTASPDRKRAIPLDIDAGSFRAESDSRQAVDSIATIGPVTPGCQRIGAPARVGKTRMVGKLHDVPFTDGTLRQARLRQQAATGTGGRRGADRSGLSPTLFDLSEYIGSSPRNARSK
jgi:hypothetical protein